MYSTTKTNAHELKQHILHSMILLPSMKQNSWSSSSNKSPKNNSNT